MMWGYDVCLYLSQVVLSSVRFVNCQTNLDESGSLLRKTVLSQPLLQLPRLIGGPTIIVPTNQGKQLTGWAALIYAMFDNDLTEKVDHPLFTF